MNNTKIFIPRCEKCNRVLDFLTKNSFKNESGKVYTCTCGYKTGLKNPNLDNEEQNLKRQVGL